MAGALRMVPSVLRHWDQAGSPMKALPRLFLAALVLSSGGCAAIHNVPRFFGGTRSLAGIMANENYLAVGQRQETYRLASGTMGLHAIAIPFALLDFFPSLALDLAFLPVSIPYTIVRHVGSSEPKRVEADPQGDNEDHAIATLREIALAQRTFKLTDADEDRWADYAETFDELRKVREGLREESEGYRFRLSRSLIAPSLQWIVTATPIDPGETGWTYFAVDATGQVYESLQPFLVARDCVRRGGKLVVEDVK